jgi:hypothetical protein
VLRQNASFTAIKINSSSSTLDPMALTGPLAYIASEKSGRHRFDQESFESEEELGTQSSPGIAASG